MFSITSHQEDKQSPQWEENVTAEGRKEKGAFHADGGN